MRCPSCGFDQTPGSSCSRCGRPLAGDVTFLPGSSPEIARVPGAPAAAVSAATTLPGSGETTVLPMAPAGLVLDAAHANERTVQRAGGPATLAPQVVTTPGSVLVPGQEFGRYHVIRQLGAGGMGAVYQAWDGELGVAVALKVILPDTVADPATREEAERRFKREIVLARQVTHTNVLRIHDLGDLGGLKYISMPYVEGDDLDTILAREGRLPVARVLGYARQIAAGLVAAHAAGVVHRDLKPANAIVDRNDHLYLLDFGIARSLTGPRATMVAGAIGTIDYMAPEQAQGQAADQRADIYAFGLIVYDLLVGRRRLQSSDSAIAELMHRMQHAPVPLRLLDPAIPEPLEQLVARCVEPDPAKRFERVTDVVLALERLDDSGHVRVGAPAASIARPAAPPIAGPARMPRWLLPVAGALVLSMAGGMGARLFLRERAIVSTAAHDPVSVLVADFENRTDDPVFDGVVEQALALGIEGAPFVTTYSRGAAMRAAATIKPGSRLDEQTARLVALREGVKLVLAGAVEADAGGFRILVNTIDPGATGAPIATESARAANKAAVLEAVSRVAAQVRVALGDTTAPPDGPSGAESFTAANLEAAHAYAQAQVLQFTGRTDEAVRQYQEAIRLDPGLGRAYSGLAAQYANTGRPSEAERYFQQALARIDRMTDREKYRTRGSYYLFTRNPDKAGQEYSALVKAFPADTIGLANLALVQFYRRDMAGALEGGRKVARILPRVVVSRNNVALYAMYAGEFEAAIAEADQVLALNPTFPKAFVARALSQFALGREADAARSWQTLAARSPAAASTAALGLADIALYQGRTRDAVAVLAPALATDLAANNATAAALKQVALAQAHAAAGDTTAAVRAAAQAVTLAGTDAVLFAAGQVLAQAGRAAQAATLAGTLSGKLEPDAQAYGALLRAEIALAQQQPRAALDAITAAQKIADTWLGRLLLARAYVDLGAYAEASSELDVLQKRRGEATAVFLDDVPTYRVMAPVSYWIGRAREGLNSPGAAESYRAFLTIKEHGDEQGLVADARRRLR